MKIAVIYAVEKLHGGKGISRLEFLKVSIRIERLKRLILLGTFHQKSLDMPIAVNDENSISSLYLGKCRTGEIVMCEQTKVAVG